ncbi:MAG: autotransporter outer membrane beta-barrel domain-containing protein [Akkermansia sp.]|nr:autotransporter outer membrane beta-barrel domain-containing protein [Akkermansia sp.]
MKLHLPFVLLAAVVCAAAYAEDATLVSENTYNGVTYKLDNTKIANHATAGDVTVTITGDYDKGTSMHYKGRDGVSGAAHIVDGNLNTLKDTAGVRYSSTKVIIGDKDAATADPNIKQVMGEGYRRNTVVGDKNIIMYSGTVGTIVGGMSYLNLNSVNLSDVYNNRFGDQHYYGYKDTKATSDINITIEDGKVDQIRGGNDQAHNDYIAKWCYEAKKEGKVTIYQRDDNDNVTSKEITYDELMENKPWAVSGDVNIKINGGTVGKGADSEAILGAGGSGHSVDGKVSINVSGGMVDGNIFAGPRNVYSEVRGGTEINISGGTITGNVYGGGNIDDGADKPDSWNMKEVSMPAPTVYNGTNITITGGTIEGSVYGAGIGDIVKDGTCITLLGGTITGGVYGGGTDDSSVVEGEKILYVGNADQEFTGSVGWVEGFTQVIVSKGSSLKMDAGNVFEVNEQIITLSSANLMEAAMSGGFALVGEKGLTLTLLAGEPLASGKYKVVELTENGNGKLRATAPAGPQGWEEGKVTFTADSIAGFDDLVWEGNILYLIYKQWNVDAAIVSNWGVFKSSQAFTGTLWGNRSNAVVLGSPAGTNDGKAPVAIAGQPATTLAWASAYGQSGRISNAGADYSLYGAAMGIERQFGATGSSIGVAFGYDWGKVSPFTTTSADQETWHAALYGRAGAWKAGKGTVSVDWSVAYGDTTTEHNDFASDWSQESWQFDVRATYAQALSERATASVFAGVQYYTHDDATVDNMHISSLQNLRLTAGAGLSYAATARTNVYGQASLYFDAMRHNPHVDTNGACFKGTNPGRIGGVLSVGADYAITDRWTLRGAYSFDAAKDSTEHNVNAGVQYSF